MPKHPNTCTREREKKLPCKQKDNVLICLGMIDCDEKCVALTSHGLLTRDAIGPMAIQIWIWTNIYKNKVVRECYQKRRSKRRCLL